MATAAPKTAQDLEAIRKLVERTRDRVVTARTGMSVLIRRPRASSVADTGPDRHAHAGTPGEFNDHLDSSAANASPRPEGLDFRKFTDDELDEEARAASTRGHPPPPGQGGDR